MILLLWLCLLIHPPVLNPFLPQLKRVREAEKQCKPLLDKNKLLNKRNDDMTQTIQKLEEKLKNMAKENMDMVRGLVQDISASAGGWLYANPCVRVCVSVFVCLFVCVSRRRRSAAILH